MRILLIENDKELCELIHYRFKSDKMNIDVEPDVQEAIVADRVTKYDAVVYGLRDLNVIYRLASKKRPLMVLNEAENVPSKVCALQAGADDYMAKPVHLAELTARMRALIRRYNGHAVSIIEAGNMTLDLDNQRVHINRQFIHMRPACYKVLECLMLRQGRTVSKEAMLDYLYGGMDEPEQKILDVYVCWLRRAIKPASVPIETVWGRGWRIAA